MPSKRKKSDVAKSARELMVPAALLEQLSKAATTQYEVEAVFRSLKKVVITRAISADMNQHSRHSPGEAKPPDQSN